MSKLGSTTALAEAHKWPSLKTCLPQQKRELKNTPLKPSECHHS